MGSRVQFFLAVVLFLGNPWSNGCSPPIVCGAPSWEERFQTEAPQSWDKYRAGKTISGIGFDYNGIAASQGSYDSNAV